MDKLVVIPAFSEAGKDKIKRIVSDKMEVCFVNEIADIKEKDEIIKAADVIIGEPDIDLINECKSLKWLQMTWAGTDKYTCNKGFPQNVILTNMSGAFGTIMSEYAIGAILSIYRKFPTYQNNQKECLWQDAGSEESLYGKTVLLLGTGDIGSNLAIRLKAFGTKNIGIRRNVNIVPEGFDEMHGFDELEKILPQADIVACSLPNKPLTRHLFDKKMLKRMKKNALLLNMGRGSLIITDDLIEVLEDGWLKGVILDVTEPEPLPKDNKLWKMQNVILTPHIAGPSMAHCPDTEDRIIDICCNNLQSYMNGDDLKNVIPKEEFE